MNNNYQLEIAQENNLTANFENNYIVFSLRNKHYAINIKDVLEIINMPELEITEQTPKGVIGIFNYNGIMIKAIDLCPFLGFETPAFSINNQIIIITKGEHCFAVHTEQIENVVQFESEDIQKIPYESENSILSAVYRDKNTTVSIIDTDILLKFLSEKQAVDNTINYANLFPTDEKSLQILKLRANQHKIKQDSFAFPVTTNSINQYILFSLDELNYYLDLKYVKEFTSIKRKNITKIPYTQDFIRGLINIKGEFMLVLDLKKFLNPNSTSNTEGNKLIITEGKNFHLAFLVDDIKYIKTLKNIPTTLNSGSGYISSEIMEEDGLNSIINFEKIIGDEKLYINVN